MDTKDAGRMGGLKTKKRGKKYYQEIQKRSVASRLRNRVINSKGLQVKKAGI